MQIWNNCAVNASRNGSDLLFSSDRQRAAKHADRLLLFVIKFAPIYYELMSIQYLK